VNDYARLDKKIRELQREVDAFDLEFYRLKTMLIIAGMVFAGAIIVIAGVAV